MLLPDRFTLQDAVATAPFDCSRGASGTPNQGQADAREAGLDTTADFGSRLVRQEDRAARLRHSRWTAPIVAEHTDLKRMWNCRWAVRSKSSGVDLVTSRYGDSPDYAHFEGHQTCGYLKLCPACARRISETRRVEMNRLLVWARSQGYHVQLMTLTARHGRDDQLKDLISGMKAAKSALHRHRAYRRLSPAIVGTVTGFEITGGGKNGWHPHYHVIVITKEAVDLDQLRDPWIASLRGKGLDGTGAGWKVQDASYAGDYVAKWGAAEEITLSDRKDGKGGSSPFQLLARACDEKDQRSKALWIEYVSAAPDWNVLRWSNGLKGLVSIDEVSDEDAAQDQKQEDQTETGRANIPTELHKREVAGRHDRRSTVLERAETVGPEKTVRELEVGSISDDVIDDDPFIHPPDFRPGGLRDILSKQMQEVRRWRST